MILTQSLFDAACEAGQVEYPQDCARIVTVARQHLNINISLQQAQSIWQSWSDGMCAGWLCINRRDDSDQEIIDAIHSFVRNRLGS